MDRILNVPELVLSIVSSGAAGLHSGALLAGSSSSENLPPEVPAMSRQMRTGGSALLIGAGMPGAIAGTTVHLVQ